MVYPSITIERIRLSLVTLFLAVSILGCGKPTSSVISDLQLRLAAQTPIRHHVRSVVVAMSGVSARSTANSEFGTPGTLTHTVDLLELGGNDTRVLEVFSLAEGRYAAASLIIHEVTVTLLNGVQFNEVYTDPQGREMIAEANTPVVVERGRKADVVIDFDLMHSIAFEGDPQRVHDITGMRFSPVQGVICTFTFLFSDLTRLVN